MSEFTPTHRIAKVPTYNRGERAEWFAIGDLVELTRSAPDDDGDVRARKAGDNGSRWVAAECLEPLTAPAAPDAPTIKRDVLVQALRDHGVSAAHAGLIADAAERRSQ